MKTIYEIRKFLGKYNLDAYIIPKNDEFFGEYAFPNRLKTVSDFSGSAGFAIITKSSNYLFIDGRYLIQGKIESGRNFKIIEIPYTYPKDVLNSNKIISIGYDPRLFTASTLKRYFGYKFQLISVSRNLIDLIFLEKKKKQYSFFKIDDKIVGETTSSKISRLHKIIKKNNYDSIFISAPENVAWLLNIRGKDNPNSPIPNARLLMDKNKKIYFFSDIKKIKKIKKKLNYKKIKFYSFNDFYDVLSNLNSMSFVIDKLTCSILHQSLIASKFTIKSFEDPIYHLKSIKNKIEIENMKSTHIKDGVALTKFLYWIKQDKNFGFDELFLEKKLESFRKKNKDYIYPSFNTIAGSGPNSAIIHYRSSKNTNRKIKKEDIFLCDSGGQYKFGTTDVTRTVCFSKPSKRIKNIFTRVLKGHIAVATNNLNKTKKGYLIDKKARSPLAKINLDYGHGTGHGVGFFSNVHEGPQALSKFNSIELREGMIISNEPGYYEEGKFGIRIENLIYIERQKNQLKFKNLTMAPIDKDLIDKKLLNSKEKEYLYKYNLEVYNNISKFLNKNERDWLLKSFQ
tara:strand:- start:9039 stop:10742 length:1704 start_codon:yes stop_codon:yes gene_type:complete